MEKRAVVKEGESPSELSGKPSQIVKQGKALTFDEVDELTLDEERLAQSMHQLYND